MGKARRELTLARNKLYETKKNEPQQDTCDKIEYDKQLLELYHIETANIIRKQFLDLAEEGHYPICEFLDIHNVENFIHWILEKA